MEIHLSGLCDVRRAENDAKRSVKPSRGEAIERSG